MKQILNKYKMNKDMADSLKNAIKRQIKLLKIEKNKRIELKKILINTTINKWNDDRDIIIKELKEILKEYQKNRNTIEKILNYNDYLVIEEILKENIN